MSETTEETAQRILDETRHADSDADADPEEWGRRSGEYLAMEYPDVAEALLAEWLTAKLIERAEAAQ